MAEEEEEIKPTGSVAKGVETRVTVDQHGGRLFPRAGEVRDRGRYKSSLVSTTLHPEEEVEVGAVQVEAAVKPKSWVPIANDRGDQRDLEKNRDTTYVVCQSRCWSWRIEGC